jgi:purine-nucleoside/S-methyl-5'-thioadenosine phosphorylase / adenosine deaminase
VAAVPTVPLLPWDGAAPLGASVAVTTRLGGVSRPPYDTLNLGLHVGDVAEHVLANRERAARSFGTQLDGLVFAHQVHGATVGRVGPAEAGRGATSHDDALAGTDVLVTTSPDVTLVILVADCVPIALVDSEARVLAAVHAGWRGTAAGAVGAAVRTMADAGAWPARVRAFVGPAVAPSRYQVADEVRNALAAAIQPAPLASTVARPDGAGRWRVDLVAANRQQLEAAGVAPEHIVESGITTANPSLFSDRAARPCGRFGLLARLAA